MPPGRITEVKGELAGRESGGGGHVVSRPGGVRGPAPVIQQLDQQPLCLDRRSTTAVSWSADVAWPDHGSKGGARRTGVRRRRTCSEPARRRPWTCPPRSIPQRQRLRLATASLVP